MKKKKSKDIELQIHDEIYEHSFLLISSSKENFKKLLKCQGVSENPDEVVFKAKGFFLNCIRDSGKDKGTFISILWINPEFWNGKMNSIISHEVLHHCFNTFEGCQMDVTDSGSQAFCFYFGYLYEQIEKEIEKIKNV